MVDGGDGGCEGSKNGTGFADCSCVSQSGAMEVEELILFDGRVGDLFTLSLNRTDGSQ